MTQGRVGRRLWFWVAVLGLTGQLAWTIENMYLNVFVYDTITDNPTALAALAGAWSDRTGRRREFILIPVLFLRRLDRAASRQLEVSA